MRKGIVITTSEYTKDFLKPCMESLPSDWPILIVSNNYQDVPEYKGADIVHNEWDGFELGGIYQGAEHFDEFVHLSDTCVVRDKDMFPIMFEYPYSMYLCDGFFSHLGKYRTEILEEIGIPIIQDKMVGINYENVWHKEYLEHDPSARQFAPPLPVHTKVFEEIHGQTRMVLDNGYIIKYKGTWGI